MLKSSKLVKELPPKRGELLITQKKAVEVTTLDTAAMEITCKSTFTTHNRQGSHRGVRASNIINDFFNIEHFRGKRILEIGPGHYSFALLARHLGATVICVERDQVFVELGRYLGFEILDMNFDDLTVDNVDREFDGLWMKGTFNACRSKDINSIYNFVKTLNETLRPEGWSWCVTANKAGNLENEEEKKLFEENMINAQRDAFVQFGWNASSIDESDRKRYALKYAGAHYYFTRNLI